MKVFAHRGWCAGAQENTLASFTRAASTTGISGIELDVRAAADGKALLVCHDPPRAGASTLTLDEALSYLAGTSLQLYVELKESGLAPRVIEKLAAADMAERSVIFAFAPVARSFPWAEKRSVRLGIIVTMPWGLAGAVRAYAPDVLFMGWDDRPWTRAAFQAWCSVFSLAGLGTRYNLPVVIGVVQRAQDLDWLARRGVHAAVADFDDTIVGRVGRR